MPASVPLRVGDADRSRVVDLLGEHYAHGRLDLAEFDQRSTRAMSAVHQHELEALLADLPTIDLPVVTAAVRNTPTRTRPRLAAMLLLLMAVGLVVLTEGAALWFLPVLWWVADGSRYRHQARSRPTRRQPR